MVHTGLSIVEYSNAENHSYWFAHVFGIRLFATLTNFTHETSNDAPPQCHMEMMVSCHNETGTKAIE